LAGGGVNRLLNSSEEKEKLTGILVDSQMNNIENAQGIFGEKKEGSAADTSKLFAAAKTQTNATLKALLKAFTVMKRFLTGWLR
jgi:hypothetical protein